MMIARPSAPFLAVSLRDPALDVLPDEAVREYALSREIDILDLSRCKDVTIFHCRPLGVEHEHLAEMPGMAARWMIFSRYVTGIDNDPFSIEMVLEKDQPRIKDVCRERIPPELYAEMATVIIEKASRGTDIPFTLLPGTSYADDRIRRIAQRALSASRRARLDRTVCSGHSNSEGNPTS